MATRVNSDFRDIVSALSSEGARYLVVGGMAVIEHTEPRYTKDLDLWVEPSRGNAARVYRALERFGAPLQNLRVSDLMNEEIVYQMGIEPVRVDILTSLVGLKFDACWERRTTTKWGKTNVYVLSARDLVENKRRVARPQDLLDVERLKPLLQASRKKR